MSEKAPSRVTTDHEEIRRWVEEGGGHPARVKEGEDVLLRIHFPSKDILEEGLENISWENFFKEFDRKRLAFLYQEDDDGKFFKFLNKDSS